MAKRIIDDLSKEDLIKVIANMQDTIQNWADGHGLSNDEARKMNTIGNECLGHCNDIGDYELPKHKSL